jgi:hypothetical protein
MATAYRLSNRNKSSRQLGNCECCGQFAAEVWMLTEMTACSSRLVPGSDSYRGAETTFGHRECVIAIPQRVTQCPDGYPSCRIAESTGVWCVDTCAASA